MSMITNTKPDDVTPGLPAKLESSSNLSVSLAMAELDQQITTARAYPRAISRTMDNILTLATLDEETAEECIYALPRAGKAIKGPSIRLAEIIAGQWGNCRVGARVTHIDRIGRFIEAEGFFHDLETNVGWTATVQRRISTSSKNGREGKLFDDDMIVVTGNAACAIAKRNAILTGVPKGIWRRAYTAVEATIRGDIKTLGERRDRAMKAFAAFGVAPERVFAVIGVQGLDDIKLDDLSTLTGMHAALKSGEASVEDMFPAKPLATVATGPGNLASKLDGLEGEAKPVVDADGVVLEDKTNQPISGGEPLGTAAARSGSPVDESGADKPVTIPGPGDGSTPQTDDGVHTAESAPAVASAKPATLTNDRLESERLKATRPDPLPEPADRIASAIAAKRSQEAVKTSAPVAPDDEETILRRDVLNRGGEMAALGSVKFADWWRDLDPDEASVVSEPQYNAWIKITKQTDATRTRR